MTTKTRLLDLPNELFPYIFQYLKSSKLVELFSKVPCNRIQSLIQSHICYLDISNETYEWLEIYLGDLFSRQIIYAIRLQDKHINYLSKYVFQTDIQSIHILNSDWSTDILKNGLDQLRQTTKQLTITFTYPHGKGDIANHLFRSDSRIEYLNITGRFLYFDMTDIEICSKLTNLSIELEGMHRLFIILEHLPQLTDLKVKFRNEDRMVEPINRLNSNSILNRVIFTGSTKYFEHLEVFFARFGHSIEYLSIQIDLIYSIIDGKRFERELLMKMPRLSSIDLLIHSTATYCEPLNIDTFQSSIWQKFHPVVYCYDIQAHEHTLFTLPYKFDRFKHLSNQCVSTWTSNQSVTLCFDRVHNLSLVPTTPFTLETFEFITKHFPHIRTLEVIQPVIQIISYMNDDLLSNLTLQLPSITKFCFLSSSHSDDYFVFRRFLYLLPCLISLQMYIGRNLFREILSNNDQSVRQALNRIQLLQMVHFYDEKSVLTNEEIHSLFPNARILFIHDEF